MQMMSWQMGRLGSRFALLFEPQKRRVMHSALGRFLDRPLDLMVGLVEPDGTERVLPFTERGEELHGCEQFERLNSITFRGYSEKYKLRFELNVHSVFYPQDERLSVMPAFYLELRVNPFSTVRWNKPVQEKPPERVKLFVRLGRDETEFESVTRDDGRACLGMAYDQVLKPVVKEHPHKAGDYTPGVAAVREQIVSLNEGCAVDDDGRGLTLDLPVTDVGSGTKWRLVWGAFTGDPILTVGPHGSEHDPSQTFTSPFRYTRYWSSVEEVIDEAIEQRDDLLIRSRRFEKLLEQAPLNVSQHHLIHQGLQTYLTNTFWVTTPDRGVPGREGARWDKYLPHGFFSVWEGNCLFHSTLDVEYNVAMFYLAVWPQLLEMQLDEWALHERPHEASRGAFLSHDMGRGFYATGQAYAHDMEAEEACNYLLLMQAYAHWTGDTAPARRHAGLLQRLGNYLLWTDRDGSGFASEGTANTIDDASPAVQYSRKQTYLAVKRIAALRAVADLLSHTDESDHGPAYLHAAEDDAPKIEAAAWLGDHYAVCADKSAVGITDVWTGKPLAYDELPGWDAYHIYSSNGLLLPVMCAMPTMLEHEHVVGDLIAATRETLGPYGCGHSSMEPENVWISQNLWRDHLSRYLGHAGTSRAARYWDMQVASNTHTLSKGFVDTYASNNLAFYPRGIVAMGYLLSYPRLMIDKLAPAGTRVSVSPDRHWKQRWPLLPLADWKAGRVPICVVDQAGNVTIEGEADRVTIRPQATQLATGVIA